jgi:putative metallohydrolase (TIGR04338 family)
MKIKSRQPPDQTDRVYEAETYMFWYEPYNAQMSLDGIKEFLADIFDDPWFRRRFCRGECRVFVHDGRGARRAIGKCDFDTGDIHLTFPRHSRQKLIVLHELAHAATGGGHDSWFCSVYLKLVRRFMGDGAWDDLRSTFRSQEVKFRCPPTPGECDEIGTPIQ